jgi:mono/diheme cytochrome c family protein
MKQIISLLFLVLFSAPVAMAADNGSVDEYRKIIESRCTSCHEAGRIEQAMAEGRNIGEILNKMQQMSAQLTSRDKDVLGIFWGSPLKEKK